MRTFQAGAFASEELADDFETAYSDGELLVQEFIKERLFTKSKSIFDTCPKNNRMTFANFQKRSKNEVDNKEMEAKSIVATLDLLMKSDPELFQKVFEYRLTELLVYFQFKWYH